MSKTTIKMAGLAAMAVSVFMILFGVCLPGLASSPAGTALVVGGALVLLGGFVMYAIVRNDL